MRRSVLEAASSLASPPQVLLRNVAKVLTRRVFQQNRHKADLLHPRANVSFRHVNGVAMRAPKWS
jgi:hypothetical protein